MKSTMFGLLIGTLLAMGAAGCGDADGNLAEHLAAAEELMDIGDFKEASIELRNALKLDPQNAETNFKIAELMERQNQLEDAIFFFGETHRLDPTRTDAAVREASLLVFDDPVRVQELLDDVLERDPANASAYIVKSRRAVVESQIDEALGFALTAIELEPESQPAYLQLGKIHQARIRQAKLDRTEPDPAIYHEATAAFGKAIEINTHPLLTFQAHIERGKVLGNLETGTEEAAAAYRSAVEIGVASGLPSMAQQGFSAAQTYALRSKNRELTVWILEQQIAFDPRDLPAWTNLAMIRESEGEDITQMANDLLAALPDEPAAHGWYAQHLAADGKLDEGLAHLQKKIEEGVDPPALLGMLAALLSENGRRDEAMVYVDRMQKEYPNHPRSVIVSARQAIGDNRMEDAAASLRKLVESYDRPEAYRLLATAERELGDKAAALTAIERFVDLSPPGQANVAGIRIRSQLQAETGACDAALRGYTTAVRFGATLQPVDHFLQARCLYQIGRAGLGKMALERLFKDGRRPPYAVVEWIDREGDKDPEKAQLLGNEALERQPDHPALLARMAHFDVLAGRREQAIMRFNKAIETGNVAPLVVLDRARTHFILGNIEQAERDALAAFEADPGLEGAGALLLTIYARQGRTEEAIRSFEEAHAVGALRPPARALLAKLHLQSGNDARALEVLDELISDPSVDLPGAKNDLAYLLASQSKDLDRAMELAQQAQRSMPKRPGVADTLGFVYLQRSLYDPALQQFRYAISLMPEGESAAVFHYHEGLALQGLGRTDEAIAAFEKTLEVDENFEDAAEALRAAKSDGAGAGGTS